MAKNKPPAHLQQRLFDPDQGRLFNPESTRPRDPGEVPYDEWLKQPGIAHHGTFNPHWESAPYHHWGDVHQAQARLEQVGGMLREFPPHMQQAYYSGETPNQDADYDLGDEDFEPQTHTGRVFARRLTMAKQKHLLEDPEANAAQYHAERMKGKEPWEIPQSVSESAHGYVSEEYDPESDSTETMVRGTRTMAASRILQSGAGLRYLNVGTEGQKATRRGGTNISVVAPRTAWHPTWEGEVLSSKHAAPMAQRFAQTRRDVGAEGSVPFESPEPPHVPISRLQFTTHYKEEDL